MNRSDNLVNAKLNILQGQYEQVRSHLQLLHTQSLGLAAATVPVILWVAEHTSLESDYAYFAAFVPLLMVAIAGVMVYMRTASLVYMDVCRSIELKINSLAQEPGLVDFETVQRKRFDRLCFARWGPGRIMYTLLSVVFLLLYVHLCARGFAFLSLKLPLWSVLVIGPAFYMLPAVVLALSVRRTTRIWMQCIGAAALARSGSADAAPCNDSDDVANVGRAIIAKSPRGTPDGE
jgi:hypothetical protein